MFGWIGEIRRAGEARRLVEVLNSENETLRVEIAALRNLCRALRDVNADLDRRLSAQEEQS
jgi:hypothetical protein